ncbi:MAG: pyrimidine 5'-nucleotidase [Pseudomonadota bacterium]
MTQDFSKIDTWLFDLDETLYPPSMALFSQIDVKMTEFVMAELGLDYAAADQLREEYYQSHGTTLAGLMQNHDMQPFPYLDAVHEIDLSEVLQDPQLAVDLAGLPGRKLIYTNGSTRHAEKVAKARGIDHVFDGIYSIEHSDFIPKPDRRAFEMVFEKAAISPQTTSFFEDTAKNLAEPAKMGVTTVLVREGVNPPDFVHLHRAHLKDALSHIHQILSSRPNAPID